MFERFTTGARELVVGAQGEARELGHTWIGTEHLLLSALTDPDAPLTRTLAGLGSPTTRSASRCAARSTRTPTTRQPWRPRDRPRRGAPPGRGAVRPGGAGPRRSTSRPTAGRGGSAPQGGQARVRRAHPVHRRGQEGPRAVAARGAGRRARGRSGSSTSCSGRCARTRWPRRWPPGWGQRPSDGPPGGARPARPGRLTDRSACCGPSGTRHAAELVCRSPDAVSRRTP